MKLRPPAYKLEGECRKCGTCCKLLYSLDDYTATDFRITQFFFPKYKRFNIAGKDTDGNLMLSCSWLTENNTCSQYDKRLNLCKNFPNVRYGSMGKLPPGCGYRLVPVSKFEDIYNHAVSAEGSITAKLGFFIKNTFLVGRTK
jgi:Fe-S-cluster containining protein